MTTTFEHASIGDRVWAFDGGWGTIVEIYTWKDNPIAVRFDSRNTVDTFSFKGVYYHGSYQTLFWDEIKFKVPHKPSHPKPPKYKNINGFRVPDIPIGIPREACYVQVITPSFITNGFESEKFHNNDNHLNHLIKSGYAYPNTTEGKTAAITHTNALLGIGEPWP